MHIGPLASASILTDVGIGFFGLFLGAAGTAGLFKLKEPGGPAPEREPDAETKVQDNEAARASMAAQQLRDLAGNVASDVGVHQAFVGTISAELNDLEESDSSPLATVRSAVAKMMAANERLQGRLEDAERKIQCQAVELHHQQEEARTDALTNLANRRAFDGLLAENIERLRVHNRPFSLVMVDIDHFKRFNDAHGHLAGDEVLREVGATLTRTVKSTDVACRFGGEELAVVLPGCRVEDVRQVAERIRKAIGRMSVTYDGHPLRVTASVGAAECLPGEKALELTRRADDGVYASKRAGRNCGHWHNGEKCLPLSEATLPAKASEPPAAKYLTREAFENILDRRILESQRTGAPISILHLTVRKYDQIRQTHGAEAGQLVVKAIGDAIGATVRGMDVIGQFEGGQFAAMLPGSTENAARIVGRRVLANVASCTLTWRHKVLRIAPQLGVATNGPSDAAASLLARASKELVAVAASDGPGCLM